MEPDRCDDLDGQVALVIGTNRGTGRQMAVDLRDRDTTVYTGLRSVTSEILEGTERVLLDVT